MLFNIYNWFWVIAGRQDQIWSSAAQAYVPTSDSTYQAWLADGNVPSTINSEAELREVLKRRAPDLCTPDERVEAAFANLDTGDLAGLSLDGFLEHENRIRAIEGKASITRTQLKQWFASKL